MLLPWVPFSWLYELQILEDSLFPSVKALSALYHFIAITILPSCPSSSPLLLMTVGHRAKWEVSYENLGLRRVIRKVREQSPLTWPSVLHQTRNIASQWFLWDNYWTNGDLKTLGQEGGKPLGQSPLVTFGCQHNEKHAGVKQGLVMLGAPMCLSNQGTVLDLLCLSHFLLQLAL